MQHIYKRYSLACFCMAIAMFAQQVNAGFATYSKDWPDDAEIVNERIEDNEKAKYLKPATDAGVCVEETYGTNNFIDAKGRLYLKIGMNYLSTDIRDLVNTSTGPFGGATINKKNAKNNYYSWEVGAGTTWKKLRVELEYMHSKETLYNSTPVLQGRAEGVESSINNTALLLNFYYDWCTFQYFQPYLGVLWGVAYNQTRTTLIGGALGTNAAAQNSNYLSLTAWGFSVGGRIPFYERWHAYVQYKYTDQGRVIWKSRTGDFRMRGKYFLQGISLGVQYII